MTLPTGDRPALPSISVVIRCYNEEDHIGRLLIGLLEQNVPDLDIVVVDSGSTDATLAIVERFPARVLHIAPSEFSFGRALNRGFEAATGEIVVVASAHVYPVYRNWLEQLLGPFRDPRVALVYGRQRGDTRTRFAERRVFERWFPAVSDPDQDHPFCNNANAAVRRTVWEATRYDESLTGLEDIDWAKKALLAGHRIAYVAAAEIVHIHNESPSQIRNRYRREAMALAHIQPDARVTFAGFLRLFATNAFSDLAHAFREGVLTRAAYDTIMFRLMQFWGTYRGFAQPARMSSEFRRRLYYPHSLPSNAAAPAAMSQGPLGPAIDYARIIPDRDSHV